MWEEWDVRRSLFDSHVAESMEANLAYMWKHFGFYFPEAELLTDPEGLLKYLVSPRATTIWPLDLTSCSAQRRCLPASCMPPQSALFCPIIVHGSRPPFQMAYCKGYLYVLKGSCLCSSDCLSSTSPGFIIMNVDFIHTHCDALQGAKLDQGHLPLYVRGDDAGARQFSSLHAVQRHMADTGRFKMAWEDNEDEYEDFYNFDQPMEEGAGMRWVGTATGLFRNCQNSWVCQYLHGDSSLLQAAARRLAMLRGLQSAPALAVVQALHLAARVATSM